MAVKGVGRRLVSPALIGRADELGLLVAAVASPPAVVVVEGEAGIGKTRLVAELLARPEVRDRTAVMGCCRRIREPFPLGPIIEALGGLAGGLATASLSPVVGALRPLLPEVAHLMPPAPEPLDDRAAERHRVFRGLVSVLVSLGPALLVVEDLHWGDEQTVDFVSYLLADPPAELALVVTYRDDEVSASVRALTAKLSSSTSRTTVVLASLDGPRTGELAAAILGVDQVSDEFAAYLCERTSGLPFAIEEVLALLQARGTLVRSAGQWARKALDELEVPLGIRDSTLERVSRLSADTRSLAEAAAVLQAPVPLSTIVATCLVPSSRVPSTLDEVLESGLFAEYGEDVGFRHLLAAQAVYEAIPGPRRRQLHGRAAAALQTRRPIPLGQLAHHLRYAGRLDEWAIAAERAADQAVDLGHDAQAVSLLDDVLRHAPLGPDHQGKVAVKLARAAIETVNDGDVTGLLSEVLDGDLSRPVRSELRFRLALLLDQAGGDLLLERRLYLEAVDELDGRPDLKTWAMVCLGMPMAPGVPLSEHLMWLHRSLEILPEVGDPAFEVFLLGKVASVLAPIGDPAWRQLTERIVAMTDGAPRQRREVNAYYSVGLDACCAGHHQTADRLLTMGLEGVASCENRRLELSLRSGLAMLDYCRGSWDGLADRAEILLDELADATRVRIDVEAVAGCLALARGDIDDARHRLTDVVRRVEGLGSFDLLPLPAGALVRLDVTHGDVDAAVANAHRFLDAVRPKGVWAAVARALPAVVQAMAAAGQVSQARALVTRCARELRDLDAALAPAALCAARGFLDAATQRWHGAARHFSVAAGLYEPLQCPYEAAQAHEQAALALFAAGDADAEQPLRAAIAAYQRLGAIWDAARAASAARQHGVSLPALHRGGRRGYGPDLSPREREVARLAATGRTNKEIATELFLSTKTVDKHLSAVLRKLGLRSRAALAHHPPDAMGRAHGKNG